MSDQTSLESRLELPLEQRPEVLPHRQRFTPRKLNNLTDSPAAIGQANGMGGLAEVHATLSRYNVELTETGLIYHCDREGVKLPLDAEIEIGRALTRLDARVRTTLNFAIGGWWNHAVCGERADMVKLIESALPEYGYEAAKVYAYVERHIPRDMRVPGIPWSVYKELASLEMDQRRFWINKAIERPGSVSVNRIRIHKKLQKAEAEKQKLIGKDEDDYNRFVVDGAAELPKTGPAPERIPASRVEVLPGLEAEDEQDEQPSEESSTGGEAFDDLARIIAVIERWCDRLEQMALQHYGEAFGQTRDTADFLELMVAAQWDKMRK